MRSSFQSWSHLAGCLVGDPTDNPLDALHPHLQLHPPLVAPHSFHRLYLPQVANYPRPTSRSLGLAPCFRPHLQLLAFLHTAQRRHICTSLPPPLLSFPLTLLPSPPPPPLLQSLQDLTSSSLRSAAPSHFTPAIPADAQWDLKK